MRNVPEDSVLFLGEVSTTKTQSVTRKPVLKLVHDLLVDVQEMTSEISDQTKQLERNTGGAPAAPVDNLQERRRQQHRNALVAIVGADLSKTTRAEVNSKIRSHVLDRLTKLRREKPDAIAFGGEPLEVQAANMPRSKQTGLIDQANYPPGRWFGDMADVTDPGYTDNPDRAVVVLTEPDSYIVFVRPVKDATAESLFEQIDACRALYGEFSELCGDHAQVFKECPALFAIFQSDIWRGGHQCSSPA